MMRPRAGDKSDAAILTVRIGWGRRSVATEGPACLREGAIISIGPFEH
ncbi:MAG: hypothetical protein IMZ71_03620 [Chloroflexi bacterium]|nr:hypothetical protein [Chloroflexota bacterium]